MPTNNKTKTLHTKLNIHFLLSNYHNAVPQEARVPEEHRNENWTKISTKSGMHWFVLLIADYLQEKALHIKLKFHNIFVQLS